MDNEEDAVKDTERLLARLNNLTREVLTLAADVEDGLPDGYTLTVSADTDVVLDAPAGEWVGIQRVGGRWYPWRGSLGQRGVAYDTLEAAVRSFVPA